ncbi:hypothetical protein [Serratia sp. UGAL515B_01]|uniref:hypothetical protein n=1 Tax=Serratia sp. UGAL515B_01 TaxID=2986763 RepID=UPI00295495E5|nr:hypothetical protein [Serratia sp. UGAL515B_01]
MTSGSVPAARVTNLSQTTGASNTAIMSQKAVTDAVGQNASLGLYQLWHDVTASRAVGSSYSNNSNRPIMVAMCVRNVPLGLYASSIVVQGIEFSAGSNTAGEHRFISVIVPPGQTYSYKPLATSNYTLLELY